MWSSSRFDNLRAYVKRGEAGQLCSLVSRLRAMDFRQVSTMMRSADFWEEADEDAFWHFAATFVRSDRKAFLGTFLRAMEDRHRQCSMAFQGDAFADFASACSTPTDRKKASEAIFPLAGHPDVLTRLIRQFDYHRSEHVLLVNLLFHLPTDAARFLFFQALKQHEDDTAFLYRYAVELIRRGDHRSLNLASVMQRYFMLPPLPGAFALEVPNYEFSRLEDFEAFTKILTR